MGWRKRWESSIRQRAVLHLEEGRHGRDAIVRLSHLRRGDLREIVGKDDNTVIDENSVHTYRAERARAVKQYFRTPARRRRPTWALKSIASVSMLVGRRCDYRHASR